MSVPRMEFGKLLVSPLNGGRRNYLEMDYTVEWRGSKYMPGGRVRVPRGFVSDYASVPRIFWTLVPPHHYPQASVLHDYLYTIRWLDMRVHCDRAFAAALRCQGAPIHYWLPCWIGVRSCGWLHWRRKTPDIVSAWRRGPRLPLDFPGGVHGAPMIGLANPPMAEIGGRP